MPTSVIPTDFANGILAYTSGPLLLLLMTLGLVQGLRGRVYEYQQGLPWLAPPPTGQPDRHLHWRN